MRCVCVRGARWQYLYLLCAVVSERGPHTEPNDDKILSGRYPSNEFYAIHPSMHTLNH